MFLFKKKKNLEQKCAALQNNIYWQGHMKVTWHTQQIY